VFFNCCFLVYRYLISTTYSLSVLWDPKNTHFVVCFLLGDSSASEFYVLAFRNRQSASKCRHIKFGCWGVTLKKEYNIQNTAKVLNQEKPSLCSVTFYSPTCLSRQPCSSQRFHSIHSIIASISDISGWILSV